MSVNYSFIVVANGSVAFSYPNFPSTFLLPAVGERIRCINPSNGVGTDYTVDAKLVTTQLVGSVLSNTVQLNCHITILSRKG